jgi:hypothetical protein
MLMGGLDLQWWSAGAITGMRSGTDYAFVAMDLGAAPHHGLACAGTGHVASSVGRGAGALAPLRFGPAGRRIGRPAPDSGHPGGRAGPAGLLPAGPEPPHRHRRRAVPPRGRCRASSAPECRHLRSTIFGLCRLPRPWVSHRGAQSITARRGAAMTSDAADRNAGQGTVAGRADEIEQVPDEVWAQFVQMLRDKVREVRPPRRPGLSSFRCFWRRFAGSPTRAGTSSTSLKRRSRPRWFPTTRGC